MNRCASRHLRILREVLSLPTSPFCEHAVIDYVRRFANARGLPIREDRFGNLYLGYRRGRAPAGAPLVLTAHMDHPGFQAEGMTGRRRLRARWRGGVQPEYFPGSRVRFFADGRWVRGVIRDVTPGAGDFEQAPRPERVSVELSSERPVPAGAVGMWDFPDPQVRGERLYARGCDDVAGVAALLCMLDDLRSAQADARIEVVLTRAEEVGFGGAISACQAGAIPRDRLIVVVETSAERPSAPQGRGPILRVGDKVSVFSPAVSDYLLESAKRLAEADPGFRFQRCLMDGGTCETTVFCEFGYQAGGLCLALGNYHNMDRRRRRIGPEYIDLGDFENLVRWFVALARDRDRRLAGIRRRRRRWLAGLRRRHEPLLLKTFPAASAGNGR